MEVRGAAVTSAHWMGLNTTPLCDEQDMIPHHPLRFLGSLTLPARVVLSRRHQRRRELPRRTRAGRANPRNGPVDQAGEEETGDR